MLPTPNADNSSLVLPVNGGGVQHVGGERLKKVVKVGKATAEVRAKEFEGGGKVLEDG
jgi:hypothetical protein